jgi:hypothetical protein
MALRFGVSGQDLSAKTRITGLRRKFASQPLPSVSAVEQFWKKLLEKNRKMHTAAPALPA